MSPRAEDENAPDGYGSVGHSPHERTNMRQIKLEPNYAGMFTNFLRDAKNQSAAYLGRKLADEASCENCTPEIQAALLRVIQGLIAPLTIAIQCATTVENIEAFRQVMADLLKDLDTRAAALEDEADGDVPVPDGVQEGGLL